MVRGVGPPAGMEMEVATAVGWPVCAGAGSRIILVTWTGLLNESPES